MKKFFWIIVVVATLLTDVTAHTATVEDEVKALSEAVITLKARVKKTENELATMNRSQRTQRRRLDRVEGEASDASRAASKSLRELSELRSATMALRETREVTTQTSAPVVASPLRQGNLAEVLRKAAELSAAQSRLLSEAGRLVDDSQ